MHSAKLPDYSSMNYSTQTSRNQKQLQATKSLSFMRISDIFLQASPGQRSFGAPGRHPVSASDAPTAARFVPPRSSTPGAQERGSESEELVLLLH